MTIDLTFYGATATVTGSKALVEVGGKRLLVDCGLFQGLQTLRERNWEPLPFDPANLDAVLLTHAHIHHSGALPSVIAVTRPPRAGPIIRYRRAPNSLASNVGAAVAATTASSSSPVPVTPSARGPTSPPRARTGDHPASVGGSP